MQGVNVAIQADGICFGYPGTVLFDGFSLQISPGEVVALLGRSGVGKSTLLRLLGRLLVPSRGSISFPDGLAGGKHARIGFVFQDPAVLPWLTCAENIALALRFQTRTRVDSRSSVMRVAQALSIDEALPLYPHQLSGGMRQRVALARALVIDPHLLCLDEPFSALDPILRREAREVVLKAITASNATTVLVTHDITDAMAVADRVLVLSRVTDQSIQAKEIKKCNSDWTAESILTLFTQQAVA